jgi:hypothetical protein
MSQKHAPSRLWRHPLVSMVHRVKFRKARFTANYCIRGARCYSHSMANERLILAIGHMERALTRLETAQAKLEENMGLSASQGDRDLADRHARLKEAAAEALAGIDTLLAGKR